ncbi:MAG: hypothetical protein GY842_06535 [bacterium]|nr:hypothetical protein [bacterium]
MRGGIVIVASVLTWLGNRRWLAVVLVGVFYIPAMTLHDVGNDLAYQIQGERATSHWNLIVASFCVAVFVCVGVLLVLHLKDHPRRADAVLFGVMTTGLAVAAHRLLFMINTESMHYAQYAILAVLLFPLTWRFGETVLLATLLGMVDEGYQYFHLHGDWGTYYDFNDTILNLIGAGFGVVMVHALVGRAMGGPRLSGYSANRMLRAPVFVVSIGALVVGILSYFVGLLWVCPTAETPSWAVVLRRGGPSPDFWIHTAWGKSYHEVQPLEGTVALVLLAAVYYALDYRARRGAKHAPIDIPGSVE